jgi:D-3-phosphoglycerate dehydrogenase / 2-oxoglutarate reductase
METQRPEADFAGGRMPAEQATDPVDSLVLDLLEWLGTAARPYDEVMDAWRTSCPRLPVWETANELGLVERCRRGDSRPGVAVTAAGRRYLALYRPMVTI